MIAGMEDNLLTPQRPNNMYRYNELNKPSVSKRVDRSNEFCKVKILLQEEKNISIPD